MKPIILKANNLIVFFFVLIYSIVLEASFSIILSPRRG